MYKKDCPCSAHQRKYLGKKGPYEEALLKSGHMKKGEKLIYTLPDAKPKKKKRKRKDQVTWFNPPYNKNTKTPVAKEVLKLVSKHFKKGSELGANMNLTLDLTNLLSTRII